MNRFNTRAVILAAFISLPLIVTLRAAEITADPVVAIVNGTEIKRSEVENHRVRLPEKLRAMPLNLIFDMLLDGAIDMQLSATRAREIGLDNNPEVKRQMAEIEIRVLERALLMRRISEKLTNTMLQERYNKAVTETEPKETINARHILVETEDQAKAIIEELNGGADFVQLAKDKSTGPSAPNGGDLGYFADGQMVPAFSKAAFALNKGEFTLTPVKTEFGWHIIKLEDRKMEQPPTYEEAEARLRATLSREIAAKYIEELRSNATIVRFSSDGSPKEDK